MTQEQKELLLKDLCSRLPYNLVIGISSEQYIPVNIWKIDQLDCYRNTVSITCLPCCEDKIVNIEEVKPYLFPLSSMTEEQKKELKAINDEIDHTQATAFEVDFYNKHHLDWRGLIKKGLSFNATGLNIYCLWK